MITENRTMSRATVEAAVESIESTWEVGAVDPATSGHHLVSHVAVETSEGLRECVLKATPEGKEPTVGDEARLLSVLGSHTSLPVPEVLGVVDEHPDLPAPFFLMSTLPGETVHRMEMDALSTETVAGIARSVGEYLADLHRLDPDGLDAFGRVACEETGTLRGGQPDPTPDRLRVLDSDPSWEGYLRSSIEGVLDHLSEGRYADLVGDVEATLDRRFADLAGPHRPAVGRIDCSLENLLIDPDAGTVTGIPDWEFTLAVAPAYDLAFVAHSLAGGPWKMVPDGPDRGVLVRDALIEGYSRAGSADVIDRFETERGCYELLADLHSAANFEDWLRLHDASEETIEAAARGHRDALRERC